uniref:Uncharacterized protein n=1 Tax=Ananas comosus var. bracteatus TaxID=296719 RepID=A0A6V7Q010_ANACO|nr:unnamed protein product [Ananas comosus var. bracteatus]
MRDGGLLLASTGHLPLASAGRKSAASPPPRARRPPLPHEHRLPPPREYFRRIGEVGSAICRAYAKIFKKRTFWLRFRLEGRGDVQKSRKWIRSIVASSYRPSIFGLWIGCRLVVECEFEPNRAAGAAGGRLQVTTSNRNAITSGLCLPECLTCFHFEAK